MKGKKRLILFFMLSIAIVGAIIFFSYLTCKFAYVNDEQKIRNSYEEQEKNCELLKRVAKDTIIEGIIAIEKIPQEKVEYKIYSDDGNIIFHYYLKEDYKYKATITLSENKILEEEYSIETETFDEFAKNYNFSTEIVTLIATIMLSFVILLIVLFIIAVLIARKNEKFLKDANTDIIVVTVKYLKKKILLN